MSGIYASTTIGNGEGGERGTAYEGMVREMRLWTRYRRDSEIEKQRYIEVEG